MTKVLVTGGCGYIGSHTIVDLLENGFDVISIDSNIRSSEKVLDYVADITGKKVVNYAVDLCDLQATRAVFQQHPDIQGLIHFAALKSVPESVEQPHLYYSNNLNSLLNVLHCVKEFTIPSFLFSSSCSVYGNAEALPVTELTPLGVAESPYAATKQMGERIAADFSKVVDGLKVILLRYFNPGGAHPSAKLGEIPFKGAMNLVPILMEVATGKRDQFMVFGDDYSTRDGSCVRDYIHIMDLANAHTKALEYLLAGKNDSACEVFNVGIGDGVTVLEAIHATEKAVGHAINYTIGPRRAGDVEAIYANYEKAAQRLGWQPQYNVDDIMQSAWAWEQDRIKNQDD